MNVKKRIFITGIAGFIGFHLAKKLKEMGHFVIGCDHFNAYYDPRLKQKRAKLLQEMGISIAHIDISDSSLETLLIDNQISHLVHLAAQAGVRYSIQYPLKYVESNIQGFFSILEVLKRNPKIKLIFASSSSVYGLNQKIPFSENDPIDKPANFYAATKISNEAMAFAYHHLYGFPVIGLRYFTVYGPWGRPDMAYYSFTRAILKKEPIQIHNLGKMQRDFTYIDDIIQGTMAAIDHETSYEIFNLGNHQPEPLLKLIEIIENKLEKKAVKQFIPMQSGEVTITYADITKSQEKLQFHPNTSLEKGMENFIDWYLQYDSEKIVIDSIV